jgi:tetratricopeptide (TPR) repeat protein
MQLYFEETIMKYLFLLMAASFLILNSCNNEQTDYYKKGIEFAKSGKNEEAIKYFDKALELNPHFVQAWNYKGNVYSDLGKYEEAIKCYDKALGIKPDYHGTWFNKGFSLFKLEKHQDAIKCFDKVLELKPDLQEALYYRGCAYSSMKKKIEMLDNLKNSIKMNNTYKGLAKSDKAFKEYWDDPDFKKLVE